VNGIVKRSKCAADYPRRITHRNLAIDFKTRVLLNADKGSATRCVRVSRRLLSARSLSECAWRCARRASTMPRVFSGIFVRHSPLIPSFPIYALRLQVFPRISIQTSSSAKVDEQRGSPVARAISNGSKCRGQPRVMCPKLV